MAGLRTTKSGSLIALVLCILFLEAHYCIEANEIQSQKLCSEDVLVLLQHLSSSPCKATNDTHIIIKNRIQDVQNCLVYCAIAVSFKSTKYSSNFTSGCPPTNISKVSDSIDKDGQLYWSKQFSFCCENSRRNVSIKGRCDYTVYNRESLELGERCIFEKQCNDSLTCVKSRCSCQDGYIEYEEQCLKVNSGYGERCRYNFQCAFDGGACSTDGICSCRSEFVYDRTKNVCVPVQNLGETCDSDDQCGTTSYQNLCLENTEIQGHCYKKFLSFGDKCMLKEQCSNHGGYCNGRCSCAYGYAYSRETKSCIRAWNLQLGDDCTSERQCGGTNTSMTCSSGICACKTGYIQSHRMCLKDGLNFGTQCMISRQCSGSPFPLICDAYEHCVCSPGYLYDNSTHTCIKAWNLQLGDACTSEGQCGGTHASMTCSSGKCACKTGYIQSHRMCLKDELNFGTRCMISRQCSGSPLPLICDTNERCVCSPGYFYDVSTYTCIKDVKETGRSEMQQSESDQDTVIVGAAVGSGVIGVIIGVMTTLGAMFLLKRSRTRKDCDTGKSQEGRHGVYEERLEVVSKQDAYEQIGSVEEKNNINKEVAQNSESMYHVVEPTPSAAIDDIINKQEEESVYNHLFEKVEESGISNYDNPHEICAGRDNQVFVEEGKTQSAGHAKQVFAEEGKTQNTTLPEDDELIGFNQESPNNDNSEADNYFVLVKNN